MRSFFDIWSSQQELPLDQLAAVARLFTIAVVSSALTQMVGRDVSHLVSSVGRRHVREVDGALRMEPHSGGDKGAVPSPSGHVAFSFKQFGGDGPQPFERAVLGEGPDPRAMVRVAFTGASGGTSTFGPVFAGLAAINRPAKWRARSAWDGRSYALPAPWNCPARVVQPERLRARGCGPVSILGQQWNGHTRPDGEDGLVAQVVAVLLAAYQAAA